jgi:hypothetical protein
MGSLDCSLSTAQPSGNDMLVKWAVEFDVDAFAGERGVFVDAKGPTSISPEPRLGWTWMGSFLVTSADAGTWPTADGGVDASANPPSRGETMAGDSGCGCDLGRRDGPGGRAALAWFAVIVGLLLGRRREVEKSSVD